MICTGANLMDNPESAGSMLNPFRSITLRLAAAGLAAVACVLFICIAVVGIFGSGPEADKALDLLGDSARIVVLTYVGQLLIYFFISGVRLLLSEIRMRT
jgi:hypothetical protein